jgi:hypothetical protein
LGQWWVELAVFDGGETGGRAKRHQVTMVHPVFRPVDTSDNMDEHAEGFHIALSSTAWYGNQKGQQLAVHDCEHRKMFSQHVLKCWHTLSYTGK